jgi:hypothetical protein
MVEYHAVLDLTEELRSSLTNEEPELAMRIPPDAFFILTTGDDVDLFVRCEEGDDPPVYRLNTPERTIEAVHASVMEWLEAGLKTAEEAIADGYFEAVSMPRKYDNTPQPKTKAPVEPLPYTLLCPGCGKRLVFCTWSGEHSRFLDFGFLYNDAGTSTLVWAAFDPAYQALFGQEMPWDLSPEQQTAFEARLKPAPAGGSWRFSNYPRCPHCKAAVSRPMTKDDPCLIYEGSLVLMEPEGGAGLKQALTEGATTPVSTPKAAGTPGRHEVPCSGCGERIPFDLPTTDDARLQNLAFLYNDSGTATLVWATTDPAYRSMFGNQKPWELSGEQQAAFEARLKPAPAGDQWRFANPARCPRCGTAISPPMTQCDLCLVYPKSLLVQHWISGSSLSRALS